MIKNMGKIDRVIRVVLSATILILFTTDLISGTVMLILMVLAIAFAASGFMGTCPLYLPFGINTHLKDKKP